MSDILDLGKYSNFDKRFVSSHDGAGTLSQLYKKRGYKVVLTQGSYDMIHIGHARYLEEAKKQGDVLFVGVDSDAKIKKRKGPHRPVVPEVERLTMLAHLRSVDHVVLKQPSDPKWNLIKILRPDVLIITARMNYSSENIEQLSKLCGEVRMLDSQAETSTSARVRKLNVMGADQIAKQISDRFPKLINELFEEMREE